MITGETFIQYGAYDWQNREEPIEEKNVDVHAYSLTFYIKRRKERMLKSMKRNPLKHIERNLAISIDGRYSGVYEVDGFG